MNQKPSAIRTRHPRLSFGDIDFGEVDANLDYELAVRRSTQPIFLRAFLDYRQFSLPDLKVGHKYLVLGQKGTGKTAILRKLEAEFNESDAITQFMIFRDEVASKEELDKLGSVFAVKVNEVKKIHHFLYTLERIVLLVIASRLHEAASAASEKLGHEDKADATPWEAGFIERMIAKVVKQPLQRVVQTALDTVGEYIEAANIDAHKLSRGMVDFDPDIVLRKQNERLLKICVDGIRATGRPVKVFIDEIHYTYRMGKDHDQDASLVRDLIRVLAKLNRTFSQERVNCTLYAAIRSEFLIHPLISAAELHPTLNTFGIEISWATYPADFSHPMFDIGAKRVDLVGQRNFDGKKFMHACFVNFTANDAAEFVRSTWSKPRDMVRFLRTCNEMYPSKVTLTKSEYSAVFHNASIKAWKEIETALTSFLSIRGLERVTNLISGWSSISLEKGSIGPFGEVLKRLGPIAKSETQTGSMNDADTFFRLLYMLGVFHTTRESGSQRIIHSFHRGQMNPDPNANVAIHRGVAKSFS